MAHAGASPPNGIENIQAAVPPRNFSKLQAAHPLFDDSFVLEDSLQFWGWVFLKVLSVMHGTALLVGLPARGVF